NRWGSHTPSRRFRPCTMRYGRIHAVLRFCMARSISWMIDQDHKTYIGVGQPSVVPSDNERTDHDDRITTVPRRRRNFLKAIGIGGAVGLAGCLGGGNGNSGSGNGGGGNNSNTGNGSGGTGTGGNDSETGGTQQGKLPPHGGSYVASTQADAADLNVLQIDEGATEDAVAQLFDGGFAQTGFKPDQTSPRWFESWDINDSYDVVEIKLRDNLKYDDKYGQL